RAPRRRSRSRDVFQSLDCQHAPGFREQTDRGDAIPPHDVALPAMEQPPRITNHLSLITNH
ncbi:MAG: hypothetical protein WAM44_18565, partial [Chthoniobacterales bacterium]